MSIKRTYYIESLGCAKNLVDSEAFAFLLEKHGYEWVAEPDNASLILVNTCSFLKQSLSELRHYLKQFCQIKKRQDSLLWVTGCVMNRALAEFKKEFPEVDEWIGLKSFEAFEGLLDGSHKAAEGYCCPGRVLLQAGFHAYLRISDGCSNNCSYCAIPSIRGPHRSVAIEDLVSQAKALASDPNRQAQELVIIAQDTCSYGMDIYGRKALPELLEALHEAAGFKWIRVMYMHPDHFETSWLKLWKKLPRLLPFFEIPIQHSHETILKAMGREKAGQELEALFLAIRKEVPNAVLRTTIMVGFPGETAAIFESLLGFVSKIRFDQMGIFSYSKEIDTPAFQMTKHVSQAVKNERYETLSQLKESISEQILQQYVGKNVELLVEGAELTDDGLNQSFGRLWFQAPDLETKTFVSGLTVPGSFINAEIYDCDPISLYGDRIK